MIFERSCLGNCSVHNLSDFFCWITLCDLHRYLKISNVSKVIILISSWRGLQRFSYSLFRVRMWDFLYGISLCSKFNPLSANLTKWSDTFKQFVSNSRRIVWVCLTILWGCRVKGLTDIVSYCALQTSFVR